MKDWTDIIGKELESILEPLPADDWKVLQQKHTASRKRKRRTAFAWYGTVSSIVAAILIALVLFRPHIPVADETLVAEAPSPASPMEETIPDNSPAILSEEIIHCSTPAVPSEDILPNNTPTVSSADDIVQDVGIGENTEIENSPSGTLATGNSAEDTHTPQEKNKLVTEHRPSVTTLYTDDFPLKKTERKRSPVTIGISGSLYGVFASGGDATSSNTSIMPPQIDSLTQQKTCSTKGYSTHDMPVSFGISARFMLSDIFALNTGLNYTLYKSDRRRYHYRNGKTESDKQYVHYLGIPVRFDLLLLNRKLLNLYIGGGIQVEKCIYATVGSEKLHEKPFIWSVSGIAGLQLNITAGTGIFFEPEISTSLNNGTLETFRTENPTMKSFRAGLRFSF